MDNIVRLDPAFHGQMLATWHSFDDDLFYPALTGWMGSDVIDSDAPGCQLIFVVLQNGKLSGLATWQEARDIAAAVKRVAGLSLLRIEDDSLLTTLRAQRKTLKAQRKTLNAQWPMPDGESEVA